MSQEFLKGLLDLGFSPLNVALIVALVVLWKLMGTKDAKQTTDREAWHADTRAQVDELKGHVEECDKDRDVLRKEQARLAALVNVRCPRRNCPMREG